MPLASPDDEKKSLSFVIRQAIESDLSAIQQLLQPFVEARKLLKRTRTEILTLMSNGFVAETPDSDGKAIVIGFSAIEIYSRKLSEIQCLAVADGYQGHGIGSELVRTCVERARDRGVLEVMAISASDSFLRNLGFDYSLPDQKRALFYQLKTREQLFTETNDE
ncbi:MAG: GNAT family N-acetyltransferase [Pirellulaceae bacterium]|nr:GNAT family N-acetyltransferase [Pirellulaceae bacterium]